MCGVSVILANGQGHDMGELALLLTSLVKHIYRVRTLGRNNRTLDTIVSFNIRRMEG